MSERAPIMQRRVGWARLFTPDDAYTMLVFPPPLHEPRLFPEAPRFRWWQLTEAVYAHTGLTPLMAALPKRERTRTLKKRVEA